MKRFSTILMLILFLAGCEKSINITPPVILIENSSFSVSEEIIIRVTEFAEVDGTRIYPDYYNWFIENSDGAIVGDNFKDSSAIKWIPQESGYFLIKVKIGYDKNKSITAIKDINVSESPHSLQIKIAGHWKGTGYRIYGGEWGIDLYVDSTGHYYGTADYYDFDPYCDKGVFNTERFDFCRNGDYIDSCGIPGDVPCQRLEIHAVDDNKGFGVIWTGWEYMYVEEYSYGCADVYDIEDLEISSDRNQLYFEFNQRGSVNYSEWVMKFTLTRQQNE
jgi:hypothetical protein